MPVKKLSPPGLSPSPQVWTVVWHEHVVRLEYYVAAEETRSHPETVGDMTHVTELWPVKNYFCAFLARVKTYTHIKN